MGSLPPKTGSNPVTPPTAGPMPGPVPAVGVAPVLPATPAAAPVDPRLKILSNLFGASRMSGGK